MRTTIRLDDDLERTLRARAVSEGVTFGRFVNRLLRLSLEAAVPGPGTRRRYKEPPMRLGPPCIDLTKALALAGQLEDEETGRKLARRK